MIEPAAVSSQLDNSVSHKGEMVQYLARGNIEMAAQQATTVLSVVNNADNTQMELERKIKVRNCKITGAISFVRILLAKCRYYKGTTLRSNSMKKDLTTALKLLSAMQKDCFKISFDKINCSCMSIFA